MSSASTWCLCVALLLVGRPCMVQPRGQAFTVLHNYNVSLSPFFDQVVTSIEDCALFCLEHAARCRSLSYDEPTSTCSLLELFGPASPSSQDAFTGGPSATLAGMNFIQIYRSPVLQTNIQVTPSKPKLTTTPQPPITTASTPTTTVPATPTTTVPTAPALTSTVPTAPALTTTVPTAPAPTTTVPTTPKITTTVPTAPAPTTTVPTTPKLTTTVPFVHPTTPSVETTTERLWHATDSVGKGSTVDCYFAESITTLPHTSNLTDYPCCGKLEKGSIVCKPEPWPCCKGGECDAVCAAADCPAPGKGDAVTCDCQQSAPFEADCVTTTA